MSRGSKRPVAYINTERCDCSTSCPVNRICPRDAVVSEPDGAEKPAGRLKQLFRGSPSYTWRIEESKCSGCLLCAQYCPHRAVEPRKRQAVA